MIPIQLLEQMWPDIHAAIDREDRAWKAYEIESINGITHEMVSERYEASRALDALLRDFASKGRFNG